MIQAINILQKWIEEEKQSGAPAPQCAVLSTVSDIAEPHARVVAIREITDMGLLFFTQSGTKKVKELENCSKCALTFWFELLQRQVQIQGEVEPLSDLENKDYWDGNPSESHIRFYSYAPTSGQPIPNKQLLEDRKKEIEAEYKDKKMPMSPFYKGFRIIPHKITFYCLRTDALSDVFEYTHKNGEWIYSLLSP
jgi:pyridoxamine 5'-phosphate oxidase